MGEVCEGQSVYYWGRGTSLSLSELVSGHIHNWETTDDAEERRTPEITQGRDGNVERFPWRRRRRRAEGSPGRLRAGSPAHVPSFKLRFCPSDASPPLPSSPLRSTCHSLPSQSVSTCRAASSRSFLTGPGCMRTL